VNISTHTYKETQKKNEKATDCLARPTNRKKTTTAEKDRERERKRKKERRSCTHTHQHHQNGTRDEVREKWWLNNEQKNPQRFSHLSQKIAKKEKRQEKLWLFHR